MSTYMAKAGQVDRKWYVIDAAGKPLGRVAAQAAVLLRGKHKPDLHSPCGLRGSRHHHQLRQRRCSPARSWRRRFGTVTPVGSAT